MDGRRQKMHENILSRACSAAAILFSKRRVQSILLFMDFIGFFLGLLSHPIFCETFLFTLAFPGSDSSEAKKTLLRIRASEEASFFMCFRRKQLWFRNKDNDIRSALDLSAEKYAAILVLLW